MERASGDAPLFTCEWDPRRYKKGLHAFTMSLEEEEEEEGAKRGGGETFIVGSHKFSLDGAGERDSGFVGMFLGLPLLQWALAFMVSGVCVTVLYMLVLPQVYGLVREHVAKRVDARREAVQEDEDDVELLLARKLSPYRYFVQENGGCCCCWGRRTALLVFWPTVTTFRTMSQVPMVQLLSSVVACVAPLVVPLAFGPAGPSGMCVFMGWGWVYCGNKSGSIEFFTLLVTGCYYYIGVMPCLLVMGAQVRVIRAEKAIMGGGGGRGLGKRVGNAIFEFWCFAATFLYDAIIFFFFLITSGTLTAFMTPCV